MAVIDAHAHIYPEKIASRAVEAIGGFYGIGMREGGTAEGLLEATKASPISHFIVHSVATTAKSVETINNFIAQQCSEHPEFVGFMTMHPDYPEPEKEIERAIGLGLKGMKLHPDTQMVDADDPRLMNVYQMLEGRIPLVLHTGDYRYDYSHPRRVVNILKAFPDLVIDAAHFGYWSCYEIGYDILHDESVFIDASSSMALLGLRRTAELIRLWGTDRVMFGSDTPMWDPVEEFNLFTSLPFSEDEMENMLWHNAERFAQVKVG